VRPLVLRSFAAEDLAWAEGLIGGDFAGRWQARLGKLVDALALPGVVAERAGERVGLATYEADGSDVEVVYLEATERGSGVGTALVDEVERRTAAGRLWLVTTNDNLDAIRFYQRRGFVLTDLRRGAVDEARRISKPSIPLVGDYGIPIRDEVVLERTAGGRPGGGTGHR
jgi:ribosomal protein S18 acetylase RimI-like enzyme